MHHNSLSGFAALLSRLARPRPLAPVDATLARSWVNHSAAVLTLRPVLPHHAALLAEQFDDGLSSQARRLRFHTAVGQLSALRLAWLATADFHHPAAFIVTHWSDGLEHAVAEGRWVRSGQTPGAESALSVADAWQRQGIGARLMAALADAGRSQGRTHLVGEVLPNNLAMVALASSLQADCLPQPEDHGLLRAELALQPCPRASLAAAGFH